MADSKTRRVFDEMFGSGSYDASFQRAAEMGRLTGEAKLQAAVMEEMRKEEEKRRKKAQAEAEKKAKAEAARNKLIGDVAKKEKDKKEGKSIFGKVLDAGGAVLDAIDRPADALRTGVKNLTEGDSFLEGLKEGFKSGTATSGKDLNKSLGFDPKTSKVDKFVADVLGRGVLDKMPMGSLIARKAFGEDAVTNTGVGVAGMATEAIADPLNVLGVGPAKRGVQALGKGAELLGKAGRIEDILRLPEPILGLPEPLKGLPSPKATSVSRKAIEDAGVGFGFSGKNEPKARALTGVLDTPVDHLKRPTEYWRTRYEDFADFVNNKYDANNLSVDALEELWTQFARYDEPFKLEQVVDMAYPKGTIADPKLPVAPERSDLSVPEAFAKEEVLKRPQRIRTGMPDEFKRERITPYRINADEILQQATPSQTPPISGVNKNVNNVNDILGVRNTGARPSTATPMSRGFAEVDENPNYTPVDKGFDRKWNQMAKQMLDKTVYVKHIENALKNIPRFRGEGSMYQKLTNIKGASAASEQYVRQNLIPALDAVEEAGGSRKTALDYIYALNMKEVLTRNPNYTLPEGITQQGIDQTIRTYQGNPVFENFRVQMQNYWKNLQDEMVSSGWLSQDQVDAMRNAYPNYVPKYRKKDLDDPEAFEQAFSSSIGPRNTRNPVFALEEGSKEKLADPIENIVKATQNIHYAIQRNKALQELDSLEGLKLSGIAPVRRVGASAEGTNVVQVRFNGEVRKYELHSDLAEAITSTKDLINTNPILATLAKASQRQRGLITGNPVFTVRNLMRDLTQGFVISKNDLTFLQELPAATLDAIFPKRAGSMADEFFKNGAGNSTMWSMDRNQFEAMQRRAYKGEFTKSKGFITQTNFTGINDILKRLAEFNQQFNDVAENIPKMAEFRASVKNGATPEEAAFNARDFMDFQKSGQFVQHGNKFIGFLNANIRGKDKFMRAFMERPFATTTKGMIMGSVPSLLGIAAYNQLATDKQKRMIDEAPTYLRDTFWLFPHPNGEDIVRVPKPFDVSSIFSAPIEYYARHQQGLGEDVGKEVQEWLKANVYISPGLNLAAPFVEVAANKDFFSGGNVVPQRLADDPKIEQKDVYTSSAAETIAKLFNKTGVFSDTAASSPMAVDHILKGVFPGAGETALNVMDKALEDSGVREIQKPEGPRNGYAAPFANILGQFTMKQEGAPATTVINQMYDQQAELKNIKKKQGEDAFQYPNVYKYLNKAVKMKHEYDAAIREVDNSPDYTPSEKKELRDRLIGERNTLARNLKEQGFLSDDPAALAELDIVAESLLASME